MTTTANLGARALQTRWFVRAPIWIYRAGLGFLFGSRLLMLQHTGRRSGARRFVVLEVVDRPAANEYIVVSGFGTTAQWYRNVRANARVRVSTGTKRAAPAIATLMTDQEAAAALEHYVRDHPKAWNTLRATIEQATGTPVHNLPMVRVRIDGS